MNLSDKILAQLKEEYRRGMTQQEIAKAHNVTHPQIQRLLSGQRDCGGLTVDTVSKMFPNATIHLFGDHTANNAAGTASDTYDISEDELRQMYQHASDEAVEKYTEKLTTRIMASDLPADVKVQVWALIKGEPVPASQQVSRINGKKNHHGGIGIYRPGIAVRRAGTTRNRFAALLRGTEESAEKKKG